MTTVRDKKRSNLVCYLLCLFVFFPYFPFFFFPPPGSPEVLYFGLEKRYGLEQI